MGIDLSEDDCYVNEAPYREDEDMESELFSSLDEKETKVTTISSALKGLQSKGKARKIETLGGDYVRSNFEKKMANWLFNRRIRYQYEKKILLGGSLFKPDFYLPDKGVYIECWGMNNLSMYKLRRMYKESVYKLYNIRYLSVNYEDMKKRNFSKIFRKAGLLG